MTTANLSVGLKTKSAKDELLALKAWMQAEMKGVKLDLGTLSLESQLKGKSLKLDVDEKALTRSVHAAVKAGLAGHHIEFDRGALTEQVRAAVAAGLSGAKLAVGAQGAAVAGATVAAGPELKTMLQQVLVPAVDELSKAAALVGGVARHAGVTGANSRAIQATSGFSHTDPVTGERLAYRKRLTDPEVALANITAGNALTTQMQAAFGRARFEASRNFTGPGAQIAGAQAVSSQFGDVRARAFLGDRAYLLDEIANLETYRKKVREVGTAHSETAGRTRLSAEAHRAAAGVMNDAHSAARGLAGSLNLLWVTWGNTAPIVAAAALGGAIRSVFVNGKDLQYQLQFVSSLSDGAAISMARFGDAVRGSMVGPVEAAQAMRGLAQNGLNVNEAFRALPEILNLATAGEMSLSDAALGATGVMAAFNLTVNDLGRVGDVFAKAAALSNTSVQGMVEAMKQASTVSDQYHVSLEETAASLAVMAKRNIDGTAAGTAFRNMMVELATPSERARQTIKKLGIDLYDSNHELRAYSDILKEVRDRTLLLNEKSRLTVLNEIFGERGAKAANAILSDFALYEQMLDQVKTKSEGFSASVAAALGETTEGKLKKLVQEFQLTADDAFTSASNGVDHFLDTMRRAVGSDDFKHLLDQLVSGVMTLTQFLVENGKTVLWTIGIWQGLKIADSIYLGLTNLAAGFRTVEVAAAGAATAGRLFWTSITGGLGLVAMLAFEFLNLKPATDEATQSQQAFNDALRNQGEELDRGINKLAESNSLLRRRVELMREGYSAETAKNLAEGEVDRKKVTDYQAEIDKARRDKARDEADLQQREQDQIQAMTVNPEAVFAIDPQISALRSKIEGYDLTVKTATENMQKFQAQHLMKTDQKDLTELLRRKEAVQAFNQALGERQERMPKGKSLMDLIITDNPESLSKEQFDAMLKSRQGDLNSRLTNVEPSSRGAQSAAHRLDEAESRQMISRLNDEKAELKDYLKFRRDLDQARYNPNLFGPFMQAAAAEQRQIQETIDLQRLQTEHTERLRAARARLSDPADRVNMDREIQQSERESARLAKRLDYETQLADAKALTRSAEDDRGFKSELSKLDTEDKSRLDKLRDNYAVKGMAPVEAAAFNAQLRVREGYAQKIAEHELAVQQAQENLVGLQESLGASTADEAARKSDLYIAALRTLGVEESRLAILKAQAAAAAATASATATQEAARAQEAGYGWDRFWAEYRSNAESNATAVYDIMKKTTGGMGDMMATFATTGKMHFRSFAASVAAEAARMLANRAIMQLLQLAVSLFGSQASYASGVTADTAGANGGFGWKGGVGGFANGGIMTSEGPVPLRRYATGGVAYGRQFAEFAEGSRPEAYVPLPDGRSIPVTVQGGGGGGGVVQANVQVHLHSDGRTSVESDASGEKAAKLGELINRAITEKLIEEKRPGGLLHA